MKESLRLVGVMAAFSLGGPIENGIQARLAARQGVRYSPPQALDCHHCVGCKVEP